MHVRQLDTTNHRDVTQFVQFPFDLYQSCPQWVPPLISSAKDLLNRQKHPFYQHSQADFFVVESEGQVLGRMAMLQNNTFNRYQQRNAAFFGYFDVVSDIDVARALFKTAFAWAKGRGLTELIGTRGLMGADGSVLVEGFEYPPALGIPYNYPYYDAFIKDSGLEKDTDYLSAYRVIHPYLENMSARAYRLIEKVKARYNLDIKTFTAKKELRQWIPRLIAVHHHAFRQLHSYYPPTEAELKLIIETVETIANPELIFLLLHNDDIVGFLLAYPDISSALQQTGGRLWPLGWARLLWAQKRSCHANVAMLGVLPAYQGKGGSAILYAELEKAFDRLGIKTFELVQVEEKNKKMLVDMDHIVEVDWYKRHRHYRCEL